MTRPTLRSGAGPAPAADGPRRRRRITRSIGLAASAALVLAACGGGAGGGGTAASNAKTDTTLRWAFTSDMQVPDPDIFYEIEGNAVVTSAYDGLLAYKPDSPEIVGNLADSYTVTPDGLTYTFKLKPGVTFEDGSPVDSSVWKASFERRTKVNQGPAYMLANVASTDASDPATFVVKLSQPTNAFLDYMASPYGPKAVNPKVVAEKAEGGDLAQKYLATHSAGTGAYAISAWEPGKQYTLTANPKYWGPKPFFQTIQIAIMPDRSTQRLALEKGDLDIMDRGLSKEDLAAIEKAGNLQVKSFPAALMGYFNLNPLKGPFKDPAVRQAMLGAIDRQAIVTNIYDKYGKLADQMTASQMLPAGLGKFTTTPDGGAALKAAVAKSSEPKTVDIAFLNDDTGVHQRVCENVQQSLAAAGLQGTCRGVPIATIFDWATKPDQGSDLLFSTLNPDAMHPDTWIRIFYNTKGFLNFLGGGTPDADKLMDGGLAQVSRAEADKQYSASAESLAPTGYYIPLVNVPETFVAQKNITGLSHQLPAVGTLQMAKLSRTGGSGS